MKIDLSCDQIRDLAKERDLDVGVKQKYLPKEPWLEKWLPKVAKRGFLKRDDLVEVAKWKWKGGRVRNLCGGNKEEFVKECTGRSFSAKSDRVRVEALLPLGGVGWPMASAILHFAFPSEYPILDKFAMIAVGRGTSSYYSFKIWEEYVEICQDKARECKVTMRDLDKALWMRGKKLLSGE